MRLCVQRDNWLQNMEPFINVVICQKLYPLYLINDVISVTRVGQEAHTFVLRTLFLVNVFQIFFISHILRCCLFLAIHLNFAFLPWLNQRSFFCPVLFLPQLFLPFALSTMNSSYQMLFLLIAVSCMHLSCQSWYLPFALPTKVSSYNKLSMTHTLPSNCPSYNRLFLSRSLYIIFSFLLSLRARTVAR